MSVHFLGALSNPRELVARPQMEPEVKRAILASRASAFAVRSAPTLRRPPELPQPIPVSDILDALKSLDHAGTSAQA